MSLLVFFLLASVAIGAAIIVINVRSAVSSALYLVIVMCALAGLFALQGALFLAALQVIVYAGAIMVLFLFVIMLLNLRKDEFGFDSHLLQKYFGLVFAAAILLQGIVITSWAMKDYSARSVSETQSGISSGIIDTTSVSSYSSANSVAETLFTRYAYPFEITSILLLAAIIGAVVIARKRGSEEKTAGN